MSRTRIVKGKITEIIGKDYNIYSESSIIDNAADIIFDKGHTKGVSLGSPDKAPAFQIKAKCLVEFRPHNNWTGEFGFDWVRMGDTALLGDTWYKNIIGKNRDAAGHIAQNNAIYGKNIVPDEEEYKKLLRKFLVLQVKFNNDFYVVPWMSLYKGKTAKLSLKIIVKEPPKKLEFQYDKTLFKLNHNEISQKSRGKHTLPDYLHITCIKTFNQDQFINVMADDELVGKLKIHKNGKLDRKKLSIVLSRVKIGNISGNIEGEIAKLKKHLQQALITPNVVVDTSIDLTSDTVFNTRYFNGTNILNTHTDGKHGDLHKYMSSQYNLRVKYPNHLIVYVFDFPYPAAGGEAYDVPSDFVLVYSKANRFETCVVHETLHALGLYHSFDNNSLFTFKKNKTEDIMDYPVTRRTIWKWQWDIIRQHYLVTKE
ncbi:hypothetical protein [Kaistella jeonii]|uniref:Uncharacterized protein n=1 Tax=Kaistella jeonii TaxID=266749 RepID=A0A0C1CK30_9FLAO|nr:hypothetical protein [Kaistella jeonii]KIA84141.1 hypothetical protein OA86_14905 [Kaistella jeonii]SFC44337.1 hypothetical protein SAMN05421876_1257 [Kaistella jeonii]VEI97368.1 Uncharacterised protein [Kaistella jeonii]